MDFVRISNNSSTCERLTPIQQQAVDNLRATRASGEKREAARRQLREGKVVLQKHEINCSPLTPPEIKHEDPAVRYAPVFIVGHVIWDDEYYVFAFALGLLRWGNRQAFGPNFLQQLDRAWFDEDFDKKLAQSGLYDTASIYWKTVDNNLGLKTLYELFGRENVEANWKYLDRMVADFTCSLADGNLSNWRFLLREFLPCAYEKKRLAASFLACAAQYFLRDHPDLNSVREFQTQAVEKTKESERAWPEMDLVFGVLYKANAGAHDVARSAFLDLEKSGIWSSLATYPVLMQVYLLVENKIRKAILGGMHG